ncbi:uncharacterized protein LOC113493046 [Trichoplusia ni]|uniref:Uncharacterized protein LOC113493046 n=1 Tax=Trichoplusia ni TaxID=7111 RepID=A0A7E5VEH4_TRINI|nr:uncharacterized protein LOC113493046 [Trichoplusia ni]
MVCKAALLQNPQRALAVRVIRRYRTMSGEAATLLAQTLPWKFEARTLALLYAWRRKDETQSNELSLRESREELRMAALTDWFYSLQSPIAGAELIAAIRPVF